MTTNREIKNISNIELSNSKTPTTTYNFTIQDNHNYFVEGVLVHNSLCKLLSEKAKKIINDKLLPLGKGKFPFSPKLSKGGDLVKSGNGYLDDLGNTWVEGPNHGVGKVEWDVQLSQKGINKLQSSGFPENKIKTAIKKGYININELGELSH